MFLLQSFLLSSPIKGTEALVVCGEYKRTGNGTIVFHEQVSLGTFFNCFASGQWLEHSNVEKLALAFSGSGLVKVKAKGQLKNGDILTIGEVECEFSDKLIDSGLCLELDGKYENIFVDLEALRGEVAVTGGGFFSVDNRILRIPKIAIVICTYQREEFIHRNVSALLDYIESVSSSCFFHLIVVDNEGSLSVPEHPALTILRNKRNVGGSGGFARGMLEVYRTNVFSHILLMDDDIVFFPEILGRLYNFLSHARSDKISVGGVMLNLGEPNLVQEWGACFPGYPKQLRNGEDISYSRNFLPLEQENDYTAWPFYCFSTKDKLLPLPFFIRGDDTEFGLRGTHNTVFLPGIAVWHHAFTSDSAFSRFLSFRNELIINSIYAPYSCLRFLRIFAAVGYFGMLYRYETARLVLRAFDEFLKGPKILQHNDYSPLIAEFSSWAEHGNNPLSIDFNQADFSKNMRSKSTLSMLVLSLFTVNGHCLPSNGKTYHLSSLNQNYCLFHNFRAERVIYWNEDHKTGYVATRSIWKFITLFLATIKTMLRFIVLFPVVQKKYRRSLSFLSSQDFWKDYLEL